MESNWIRVSKKSLCPICDHDHYCSVSADGKVVHCMHAESRHPNTGKAGGWNHFLDEPAVPKPRPKVQPKQEPVKDFGDLACKITIVSE